MKQIVLVIPGMCGLAAMFIAYRHASDVIDGGKLLIVVLLLTLAITMLAGRLVRAERRVEELERMAKGLDRTKDTQ